MDECLVKNMIIEGQSTHHKMVSLEPLSGFSPMLFRTKVDIKNIIRDDSLMKAFLVVRPKNRGGRKWKLYVIRRSHEHCVHLSIEHPTRLKIKTVIIFKRCLTFLHPDWVQVKNKHYSSEDFRKWHFIYPTLWGEGGGGGSKFCHQYYNSLLILHKLYFSDIFIFRTGGRYNSRILMFFEQFVSLPTCFFKKDLTFIF